MKKSNELERSRGVLLFASNTETVDYVKIANRSAKLIEHFLNVPVTIVSNQTTSANKRFSIDSGTFEQWNNLDRYMAYQLSPYDQTLLLDSDYLVLDKNLLKLFDVVNDYIIPFNNINIDNLTMPKDTMGTHSLPFLWATIVAFNKTDKTEKLFDLVRRVQKNYRYYTKLYNIKNTNYRNDYAFAIADNIINGYTQDCRHYLPWTMLTVSNKIKSMRIEDGLIKIKEQDKALVSPLQSLHIMSKQWLLSDECDQFIKEAING